MKSGQPGWEQRRLGLTGMLTAFYEQSSPLNGPPRSACGSLPSGEAGIKPTSLKDRPDIFWAQSILSLLLGSCTHTDMVQTNSIVEIIPPSHHDNNWAASPRNETRIRADPSITDQAARAKSVRVFSALIDSQRIVNKLTLGPHLASPGTTVRKTLHCSSAITALTPTELIRISTLSLAPPQHDPHQRDNVSRARYSRRPAHSRRAGTCA